MENLEIIQIAARKVKNELVRVVLQRAYWHSVQMSVAGESKVPQLFKELARQRKNAARRMRDQAYRDCGLVRVRGALGGVYWE